MHGKTVCDMPATLRRSGAGVLHVWERRRRRARERRELPRQMGLIGVAALRGETCERHAAQTAARRLEADQAGRELRRRADLGPEPVDEMPPRAAERRG